MWLLIAPNPRPDAVVWPGRRVVAAVDAVLWPLLGVWLLSQSPLSLGLFGPTVAGVGAVAAVSRLRRAVWENQRYRFSSWKWGRAMAVLVLFGMAMKLMADP
jgi:hypothetical protein